MHQCCVRARVTGRVQGVGYRWATREQARQAGLTGYARNLADGSVEVLLCGAEDAVSAVGEWLRQGPPEARVTHVELARTAWGDHADFVTR